MTHGRAPAPAGAGPMTGEPGIEVSVADAAWGEALADPAECCRRAAAAALAAAMPRANGAAPAELGVVLADDRAVAALNLRYRGRAGPTNVLAFDAGAPRAPGAPRMLGDVVLARETVAAEAAAAALPLADHASHLIVHGVLHLLGYRHDDASAAAAMQAAETRALGRIGVADPWRAEDAAQ